MNALSVNVLIKVVIVNFPCIFLNIPYLVKHRKVCSRIPSLDIICLYLFKVHRVILQDF
jgi:hypothetical protein